MERRVQEASNGLEREGKEECQERVGTKGFGRTLITYPWLSPLGVVMSMSPEERCESRCLEPPSEEL
jgi:hypothetical protein